MSSTEAATSFGFLVQSFTNDWTCKFFQCTAYQKNLEPEDKGGQVPNGFPLGYLVLPRGVSSPPHSGGNSRHGEVPVTVLCFPCYLSSLAMSARLSHSAIGSPYDRTPAHCPNAANLRPSPWWSSSGVTATTCLHSNWLLTTSLERNKHTHRNARIPSG